MSQSTLHVLHGEDSPEPQDRPSLGQEKLGVIAGFLLGLPVGISAVGGTLTDIGSPQWLANTATIAVVAAFTWAGWRLATRNA